MVGFARIAALMLVLGMTGLLWWTAKRKRAGGSPIFGISFNANNLLRKNRGTVTPLPNRTAVLQRTQLTPTHHLHTVSVGDETFLLCTYPGGCRTISRRSPSTNDSDEQVVRYASSRG